MPKVKKSTLAEVVEAEKVLESEMMEEEEEDVEEGEDEEEEEEMEDDEEEMEEEEEEEMEEEEEEEEVEEVVKPPTRSKKPLKNAKVVAASVPTPRTTRQQKAVSIKKTVSPRSSPAKRKVIPKPSTSADAVAAALAKRKKTDEPITLDIADKKLEEMIVPEFSCHIGNKWYVRTSKYYGRDYICIRQYNDDGSSGPGLKGANIDIDLFPKVLEGFLLFDKTMKRTQ